MRYLVQHAHYCGCQSPLDWEGDTPQAVMQYLWGRDMARHTIWDTTAAVTYRFHTGSCAHVQAILEATYRLLHEEP
jgi:hypothetical protein